MELWLIFAFCSIIFWGLKNFALKVISKKQYNVSLVSFYSYVSAAIISGWYYVYLNYGNIWKIEWLYLIWLFALWKVIFGFLNTKTKVMSLDNIDSTIFFPLFKTITLVMLTACSLFVFWEKLTFYEWIWILIGMCWPFLLITKKESKKQVNLKKGIVFLIITSLLMVIISLIEKSVNTMNFNVELFVFLSMLFGVFVSWISYKTIDKKNKDQSEDDTGRKWLPLFWLVLWLFHFLTAYTFVKALEWNLAIVYTINSFSILVPIILSVIFYKEEMTIKKALVIFLSIVSVILFI